MVKIREKSPGRFPEWIRVKAYAGHNREDVAGLIEDLGLHTVCQSAKCPNLGECWHHKSATFMIMGDRCTRNCTFCAVECHRPEPLDPAEPENLARAAARMGLRYVVVTSVTRDDLPDGGAGHFVATIAALRRQLDNPGIEVLTPDFLGEPALVGQVLEAQPTVFNHNLETCERLTREIRSGAQYRRSLEVLRLARERAGTHTATKSGIMVGLGETDAEVEQCLRDLADHGVQILTIGQYLPPSRQHRPLDRYVTPEQFAAWAELARSLGFRGVASSPLVRSSYRAEALARQALAAAPSAPEASA